MGRRSQPSRLHGFLVIDKPAGWTSHDVVGRVRRLVGERKVGHAGTLDPAATGVLPVAVGDATRIIGFLSSASKTYLAEVTFGVETDSADIDGRVIATADATHVTAEAVEQALVQFRGPIEQIPPMHSAIKVDGKRLYEAARRGETVERAARPVTINELELTQWEAPVASLCVDCSKGTYIRTLATDLGDALGTGAYLSNLVRVRTGPFTIDEAWTLDQLASVFEEGADAVWSDVAVHPDRVIEQWPAIVLDSEGERLWTTGRPITGTITDTENIRAYSTAGHWLGIGEAQPGQPGAWQPQKVIQGSRS